MLRLSQRALRMTLTERLAKSKAADNRTSISKILWNSFLIPTGILAHTIIYQYTVDSEPAAKVASNRPLPKTCKELRNYQKKYIELTDLEEVIKTGEVEQIRIFGLDDLVTVVLKRKQYENELEKQEGLLDFVKGGNVQVIKRCSKLDFYIKLMKIYEKADQNIVRVTPVPVSKDYEAGFKKVDFCPDALVKPAARICGNLHYLHWNLFENPHEVMTNVFIILGVLYINL